MSYEQQTVATAVADLKRVQRCVHNVSPAVSTRIGALIRELEWKVKQNVAVREGES